MCTANTATTTDRRPEYLANRGSLKTDDACFQAAFYRIAFYCCKAPKAA